MHTDTIAGLCAALDAGDHAVLPILADALEEAGEEGLAAGLRRLRKRWPRAVPYYHSPGDYRWFPRWRSGNRGFGPPNEPNRLAHVAGAAHARLKGRGDKWFRTYPTRSGAFLALAAALAPGAARQP